MTAPTAPEAGRRGFRPDVQGLRAVAVVLVILFHADIAGFGGGFVGVDVFFVLSGFLITGILVKELGESGRLSFAGFYARRFRRIAPVAAVVFIVTLVGVRLRITPYHHQLFGSDARASALFAMNVRGQLVNNDYLVSQGNPDAVITPYLHYWSLAVEEQFYAVWPVFLVLVALVGSRATLVRRLLLALGALCVASFVLSVALTSSHPIWAFYLLPTRAWELGAGGLVSLGVARFSRLPGRPAAALTWVGLLTIVVSGVVFRTDFAFPGWVAAVPVLGTVAVLVGGCAEPAFGCERVLKARPFQAVGALSYALYMWHWPLLQFINYQPRSKWLPITLVLVVIASVATHLIVENPVRKSAWLLRRPRTTVLGGLALAALMVASVSVVLPNPQLSAGRRSPGPEVRGGRHVTIPDTPPAPATFVPSNLEPPLWNVPTLQTEINIDGCMVPTNRTHSPTCAFGDLGSPTRVVLFGDSHASHLFPVFRDMARDRHWRLEVLTKAGCPAASATVQRKHKWYTRCDTWRANALARIRAERPQLVVISDLNYSVLKGVGPTHAEVDEGWRLATERTLRALPTSTAAVVIGPTPILGTDVPKCLVDHLNDPAACSESPTLAIDRTRVAAAKAAADAVGASFLDLARIVCNADPCPLIEWNVLLYSDSSHLLPLYVRTLEPAIRPVLERALGG